MLHLNWRYRVLNLGENPDLSGILTASFTALKALTYVFLSVNNFKENF